LGNLVDALGYQPTLASQMPFQPGPYSPLPLAMLISSFLVPSPSKKKKENHSEKTHADLDSPSGRA
jgi:hypothetical protein